MAELNQVHEVESSEELFISADDNENLFDDYEVEETTETLDEPNEEVKDTQSVETEGVTEVSEETSEEPYGLKIKFNGEEMNLNEEEARTLAQKGMNYDRFYEPIERLARMNGMSVGDYLNKLNDTQVQYEVAQEVERLRNDSKYDGVSDEVLEEIASNHVNESIGNRDKNYQEQQQGIADAEQARIQRDVDLFFEEYPEYKNKGPDVLDPKVFDYVKKGYTLLEAYNKWAKEQADIKKPQEIAKEKVSKLNEENKKKSLGNTTNAGSTSSDDFLNGFLNG